MTRKTKLLIRALADQFRLRIKYVNDLPAKVAGFLDPSKASHTIVVNATKSKSDHAFTILHEIAHYILHFQRSHQMRLPWYLTRQWKSQPMNRFSKTTKRLVSRKFDDEWQADMWAVGALLFIGAKDDFQAFVNQHPDKTWLVSVCLLASIYTNVKFRVKSAFRPIYCLCQKLLKPAV
jgi:hypothetical protein